MHQAGSKVELTLASGADGGDAHACSSRRWPTKCRRATASGSRSNRAWVHEQSDGRVGYFHLPDMESAGFAEFHRYFSAECDRDALIVDVRYNRGGHVSQLLLEKIARKRIGYDVSRWMKPSPYPDESVAGPVVALTNEHAGSDGDIFSHNFKLMGSARWSARARGAASSASGRGTRWSTARETTQPEFSFWFNDVGLGVENYGTDPADRGRQRAAGRGRRPRPAARDGAATALGSAYKTTPNRAPVAARPVLAKGGSFRPGHSAAAHPSAN